MGIYLYITKVRFGYHGKRVNDKMMIFYGYHVTA